MERKVICSKTNYCKINITEDSIKQEQLLNNSIFKIKITTLKKIKDNLYDFMIIVNLILK